MIGTIPDPEQSIEIGYLDELIKRNAKKFLNEQQEPVKLGDLLKMIELKRKLSPTDAEQKKFWKMLDQIRKETLETEKPKPPKKEKRKKQK